MSQFCNEGPERRTRQDNALLAHAGAKSADSRNGSSTRLTEPITQLAKELNETPVSLRFQSSL